MIKLCNIVAVNSTVFAYISYSSQLHSTTRDLSDVNNFCRHNEDLWTQTRHSCRPRPFPSYSNTNTRHTNHRVNSLSAPETRH